MEIINTQVETLSQGNANSSVNLHFKPLSLIVEYKPLSLKGRAGNGNQVMREGDPLRAGTPIHSTSKLGADEKPDWGAVP